MMYDTKFDRRRFLALTSSAVALGAMPRSVRALDGVFAGEEPATIRARDARVKSLALKALDAAQQTGATYADVRLTIFLERTSPPSAQIMSEKLFHGIGVRALYRGYWGFASTPFLNDAEVTRVGSEAAALAIGNASAGGTRTVEWDPIPVVRDGDWMQPAELDPLEVSIEEVLNWRAAASADTSGYLCSKYPYLPPGCFGIALRLARTDSVFASTDGGYQVQTFYRTQAGLGLEYPFGQRDPSSVIPYPDYVMTDQMVPQLPATCGWETVLALTPKLEEIGERTVLQIEQQLALPLNPVDVGRYDVVTDWQTMGHLTNATLGAATELDRAMGYEANSIGTSYLGPDPADHLDSVVASPVVSLVAERTTPAAFGTVQWDAEGVKPEPFQLVKDGKLVDYQTTRESAAWLRARYQRTGQPVRSHGCAGHVDVQGLDLPLQHRPNLTMTPAREQVTMESLVANVKKGLLVRAGQYVQADRQALNGFAAGCTYEIHNGKIVARIKNAGFLFRSPELWKNVTAIGGSESARWTEVRNYKGEPGQRTNGHVKAVPAHMKDLTIIDVARRG